MILFKTKALCVITNIVTVFAIVIIRELLISNEGGDGNKDVNAIGLLSKTTTLHVHHAFSVYISLPFLYDYDVKMPNFKFSCRT